MSSQNDERDVSYLKHSNARIKQNVHKVPEKRLENFSEYQHGWGNSLAPSNFNHVGKGSLTQKPSELRSSKRTMYNIMRESS